ALAALAMLAAAGVRALTPPVSAQAQAQGQAPASVQPQSKRVVIAASTVFDGKGGVLRDTRVVVDGGKVLAIDPKAEPIDYDLRGLTVMPGWIDAHVHLTWIFGKDGKNLNGAETTMDAAYRTAANAWADLMAGFTTVQSVGSPGDVPLRDV